MTVYLLDTNYLLYMFDTSNSEQRKQALQKFAEKLQADDSRFVTTSLVRYEVLRGVGWKQNKKYQNLSETLEQFESLDITREISDLAGDLYRFDKFESERTNTPRNLEKRKFDTFHYATAAVNNLQMLSFDADIARIKALHEKMKTEVSESSYGS